MADFVQNGNIRSPIRTLAEPTADAATFNTIVRSVITTNPFACVACMTSGERHPARLRNPVERPIKMIPTRNSPSRTPAANIKNNTADLPARYVNHFILPPPQISAMDVTREMKNAERIQ
ncbi:hypothetical protein [uncultured Methanoregula sp.]|uniref:hypothetical protein n=1 Tax=uncultured Methanoregula sp. TaxID=1005933 RepID=UPI002AAB6214|nr:hypothetical protein [uncultured Methanoregula sp.]